VNCSGLWSEWIASVIRGCAFGAALWATQPVDAFPRFTLFVPTAVGGPNRRGSDVRDGRSIGARADPGTEWDVATTTPRWPTTGPGYRGARMSSTVRPGWVRCRRRTYGGQGHGPERRAGQTNTRSFAYDSHDASSTLERSSGWRSSHACVLAHQPADRPVGQRPAGQEVHPDALALV
jgi:hypothetical protein